MRWLWVVAWFAAALGTLLAPAFAQSPDPAYTAADFAERSALGAVRMAPDGSHIAFSKQAGKRVTIAVMTVVERKLDHEIALPAKGRLEWYNWAGSRRLLVSISHMDTVFDRQVRLSRLFVYDLDTRRMEPVGRGSATIGDNVLYTDPRGDYVLAMVARDFRTYPAVWKFPLSGTADARKGGVIQGAKPGVMRWAADTSGVIRLGFEYGGTSAITVWYRGGPGQEYRIVARLDANNREGDFWSAVAIVGESDTGFVLKPDASGRNAIQSFNFATQATGKTVLSAQGWDVDKAVVDSRTGALLGMEYTDDRRHVVWIDRTWNALQEQLSRALGGKDVRIVSWSDDQSAMVIWAGAGDDPGAYYTYDSKTGSLALFDTARPRLDPARLARPTAVAYPARDGILIPAILTLPRTHGAKPFPLIILPHGGPFWIRDRLEFDTEAQFLASRGYAVLQPNFRGSGGYGEAFDRLGRGTIGRAMQDDLDDGMDWLVAQGIADPARACIVGASYGGYAALWGVIRNPERYRCAASYAGVTDWRELLRNDRNFFNRGASGAITARLSGEDETFDFGLISPATQIARLRRPVLLAHGERDPIVPFSQFKIMQGAASKAGVPLEVLVFPDEGHGFARAEDEAQWLERLAAFLAKYNPPD
ncbi:alpha/beta hydrolase family protein [Novosphingobium sp.]|uniref:alpha/beta hydrolase family protein n=1 Tax=Novosphingobium sp. TaxID=1874826 RepID=UPI0035AE2225